MVFDRSLRFSGSTWYIFIFGFLLVHHDFAALTWTAKKKALQSESDCLQKIVDCVRLRRIGMKIPGKMVRTIESFDDLDDYSEDTNKELQIHIEDEKNTPKNKTNLALNTTRPLTFDGFRTVTISLHLAGIILVTTILITCCCTLLIRRKCANFINRFRGKKTTGKFKPMDVEKGKKTKRRLSSKSFQVFGNKQPSYETVNTATQHSFEQQKELETRRATSPTGCFKCSKKKKRKKNTKSKR